MRRPKTPCSRSYSKPASSMSDVFSNVRTSVKNATVRSMFDTVIPTVSIACTRDADAAPSRESGAAQRSADSSRAQSALRDLALTSAPPFNEGIADAKGVGHNRQGRIHRAARRKEAAVDDIEVVDVVRLAHRIERRRLRVVTKADGAVLMRHARQRNPLTDEQASRKQSLVTAMPVLVTRRLLLQKVFKLRREPRMPFAIVRRVPQLDVAVMVQGQPLFGVGQILGRQPEVQRVLRHEVEREA